MWLVNPKILCKDHLLGEHYEIHKLVGNLKRRRSISKFVKNNCVEVSSIKKRHDKLAIEMTNRNYNHRSPIEIPDTSYLPIYEQEYEINISKNLELLLERCVDCKLKLEERMNDEI